MSSTPGELRYTKSHEWLRDEEDGSVVVGITDYAQNSLGDITFVQLPKPGSTLRRGEVFGVVESVKAASDLYAPVTGEVLAVNAELDAAPELLNRDPYQAGWLLRLKRTGGDEATDLLDSQAYAKITE